MTTRHSQVHFADKTLAGVPKLLDDLQKVITAKEMADLIFLIGTEQVQFYSHSLIVWARYCFAFSLLPYLIFIFPLFLFISSPLLIVSVDYHFP